MVRLMLETAPVTKCEFKLLKSFVSLGEVARLRTRSKMEEFKKRRLALRKRLAAHK